MIITRKWRKLFQQKTFKNSPVFTLMISYIVASASLSILLNSQVSETLMFRDGSGRGWRGVVVARKADLNCKL